MHPLKNIISPFLVTPPSGPESLSLQRVLYNLQFSTYAVLGSIGFLMWCFLYPRYFSPLRKVPGPPLGSILFGHLFACIRGEPGMTMKQWIIDHGPVVRLVGPFGFEGLLFTKPAALQKILTSDWINYPRPSYVKHCFGFFTGYGLLATTGEEHKEMRHMLEPAFSISNLMAQTDMYHEPIKGLLNIIQEKIDLSEDPSMGKVVHMYDWMSRVTLDIICETAFGYTADSLHNPHGELSDAYEKLIDQQSSAGLALCAVVFSIPGASTFLGSDWAYRHRYLFGWIPGAGPLEVGVESMHRITKIAYQMVKEKTQESALLTSESEAKRDVMSLLVRARGRALDRPEGKSPLTDYAMVQHVLTFLGAGHETIASGLSWALWLLANDTQSQTKLREEVSPLFATHERPEFRGLQKLPWLDCVIMESLRVLPSTFAVLRTATKTGIIDGILVPSGTTICIPIRAINASRETWGDDAEDFKPERWLNLPPERKQGFAPFMSGAYGCIGKHLAIMEMKAVIAALISKFHFEPAFDGQKINAAGTITMKPTDGLPLRVRAVGESA